MLKVGDKVVILKGHVLLTSEEDVARTFGYGGPWSSNMSVAVDMHPEFVGKVGVITKVSEEGNSYSLQAEGVWKAAWYPEAHLRKIP